MKLCIPAEDGGGLNAKVSQHFGSAPFFVIHDTQTAATEIVTNSNAHHAHGMCHPLAILNGKDISAIVCAGMGARAVQGIQAAGIRAYLAAGAGAVRDCIENFRQGKLEEITVQNACSRHSCR